MGQSGNWWRFWSRAARNAFRWGESLLHHLLLVVDLLALVGVAVAVRPLNVVLLAAALIVALSLCQGAFFTWQEDSRALVATRAELDRLKVDPVSERHFEELKAIIRRAEADIRTRQKVDDGTSDWSAMLGHFPDLEAPLREWNGAMDRLRNREVALNLKMGSEADKFGIVEPTYARQSLLDMLLIVTKERADRGLLEYSFEFNWFGGIRHGGFFMADRASPVIRWSSGQLDEETATSRVESLFWAAQRWDETIRYADRNVDVGWGDLQSPLLDRLQHLLERDHFKRGDGCPRCN